MRLLALSDIHGNISAVQQLRLREPNIFDAVVVAGDISASGNCQGSAAILNILESFRRPVLYVYGNWDYELDYDQCFGPACHHLHLNLVKVGGFSFVGFSGVPVQWGKNPIAARAVRQVTYKRRDVVKEYKRCAAYLEAELDEIETRHKARVLDLQAHTNNLASRHYLNKLKTLDLERFQEEREIERPLRKIRQSKQYAAYELELGEAEGQIESLNRLALVKTIQRSKEDSHRIVVVTHGRIYRTSDDLSGIPLFLFGHQHGFKDTSFKGSRFVNVSVLDRPLTVKPVGKKRVKEEDWRNINTGNYAIIEARDPQSISVRCVDFQPNFDAWKPIGGSLVFVGLPWVDEPISEHVQPGRWQSR